MTELCSQKLISNLVVWNWKCIYPRETMWQILVRFLGQLLEAHSAHMQINHERMRTVTHTLFLWENVSQPQNKVFLPPPLPTSMSKRIQCVYYRKCSLRVWAAVCYGLGWLIHRAEIYSFSYLSCPSLVSERSEGRWGVFPRTTCFRTGLLEPFWRENSKLAT